MKTGQSPSQTWPDFRPDMARLKIEHRKGSQIITGVVPTIFSDGSHIRFPGSLGERKSR